MTEIEKVSIGGYAFTLEKDASAEVEKYLKNLEAHYLGKEGGKEIMEGIEERMAELLLERCGRNGVATMADIQSLIGILGRPERIEADDPEPEQPQAKPRKKLYGVLETRRVAAAGAALPKYFTLAWASISTSTWRPCGSFSASSPWHCSSQGWMKGPGHCPDSLHTLSSGWRCRRHARRRNAGR